MMHLKNLRAVLLVMISCVWLSSTLAQERALVAELHAHPPPPCVAKGIDDMSSGIAIAPAGNTREEVRGIMGGMAALFLSAGADYMTARNIQVVYTAVFFEESPLNEIGIYAYRFAERIEPGMFKSNPELNGKLFVIDGDLLVVLWREDHEKTARCFAALDRLLTDRL